jgi:dihydroorotate dehydrogenase
MGHICQLPLPVLCAAGARVVEANFSCPNVGKGQGTLYADAQQVAGLTAALVQVRGVA